MRLIAERSTTLFDNLLSKALGNLTQCVDRDVTELGGDGGLREGPAGEAQVDIRAVSFVSDGVANVRFHRIVRQSQQVTESDWIATIAYAYTKAPMGEADRLRNPLGFQVTSYRADPEVVR